MNPSTADLAANYQVEATIAKQIKKKPIKVLKPINFTEAYMSSDKSVTLMIAGNQKFAEGGQMLATAARGPLSGRHRPEPLALAAGCRSLRGCPADLPFRGFRTSQPIGN